MSRAFVREDAADTTDTLPERPVSAAPNYVTATGLRQIDTAISALEQARDQARRSDDRAELARIERDLRYWLQRRASAQPLRTEAQPLQVRFGVRVTLERGDGSAWVLRLVGEDEADPAAGLLSWAAPLAQALVGRAAGEAIVWQGETLTIVALAGAEEDTAPPASDGAGSA